MIQVSADSHLLTELRLLLQEAVAIWDGKKVVVYEVSGESSIIRAAGDDML